MLLLHFWQKLLWCFLSIMMHTAFSCTEITSWPVCVNSSMQLQNLPRKSNEKLTKAVIVPAVHVWLIMNWRHAWNYLQVNRNLKNSFLSEEDLRRIKSHPSGRILNYSRLPITYKGWSHRDDWEQMKGNNEKTVFCVLLFMQCTF